MPRRGPRARGLLARRGRGADARRWSPPPASRSGCAAPDEVAARVGAAGRGGGDPAARRRRGGPDRGGARRRRARRAGRSTALAGLARGLPGLDAAVDRLAARLDALAARGIAPEALRFEASFGRTTLEYYDGFVFGALPRGRDDLPPIASGGRYDALTRVLGRGRGIPAVGGMIRPEALVALREGMRLKLGVPSKGRLQEETIAWFAARGVTVARSGGGREYRGTVAGVDGVELVLLSAGEIPRELAAGRLHLGVTGQDLVREEIPRWAERRRRSSRRWASASPTWWWRCRPSGSTSPTCPTSTPRRPSSARGTATGCGWRPSITTSCASFFQRHGVADYQLVDSQGATEGTVKNLTAEAVADITTTARRCATTTCACSTTG